MSKQSEWVHVDLMPYEIWTGGMVGIHRHVVQIGTHNKVLGPGWNEHIQGACAELAYCKALNLYFPGTCGIGQSADIGNVAIKSIDTQYAESGREKRLMIRASDYNYVCVLVLMEFPHAIVFGWITANEGRQVGWLDAKSRPNDPAYFVRVRQLHPMSEIPKDAIFVSTPYPKGRH